MNSKNEKLQRDFTSYNQKLIYLQEENRRLYESLEISKLRINMVEQNTHVMESTIGYEENRVLR